MLAPTTALPDPTCILVDAMSRTKTLLAGPAAFNFDLRFAATISFSPLSSFAVDRSESTAAFLVRATAVPSPSLNAPVAPGAGLVVSLPRREAKLLSRTSMLLAGVGALAATTILAARFSPCALGPKDWCNGRAATVPDRANWLATPF